MGEADTLARMERMYRPQIGFYDLTRKPYLLGRDRLIATMPLAPGDLVCEVGCGTGRNLARLARRDPSLRLFGLDASAAMLERAKLRTKAQLARGLAEQLDPAVHFGIAARFDRIVFSYSLSMIPDWRGALARALASLRPGGTIAIVDFGDQKGWTAPSSCCSAPGSGSSASFPSMASSPISGRSMPPAPGASNFRPSPAVTPSSHSSTRRIRRLRPAGRRRRQPATSASARARVPPRRGRARRRARARCCDRRDNRRSDGHGWRRARAPRPRP